MSHDELDILNFQDLNAHLYDLFGFMMNLFNPNFIHSEEIKSYYMLKIYKQ